MISKLKLLDPYCNIKVSPPPPYLLIKIVGLLGLCLGWKGQWICWREGWIIVNRLSLNASKTKIMVFNMPQKKVVIPRLKLADTEIESVDQFNFLGITLDKHLNWNAHTNKLVGKISRNTGMLNKIKLFLPSRILNTIYSSLILCQLNYGILIWGQNYKRIFKLQKRVMRIITCSK